VFANFLERHSILQEYVTSYDLLNSFHCNYFGGVIRLDNLANFPIEEQSNLSRPYIAVAAYG
jgi:hypothetical protein